MTTEMAFVFDKNGKILHWKCGVSEGAIPDSNMMWNTIWNNREDLGGVAHSHPWNGEAHPSGTDLTTFAAIEAGLGRRLYWPIITMTDEKYYRYLIGIEEDGRYHTVVPDFCLFEIWRENIKELRERSQKGV